MHPNYPAMVAILPLVKRVLPQARIHGSGGSDAGGFITCHADDLALALHWDKEHGYALEVSSGVEPAHRGSGSRRVSETFTSPGEFESTLRGLLNAPQGGEVRRPRQRPAGSR